MLELGDYAVQGHQETGAFARENGVDCAVGIGPLAKHIVEGFGPGGTCGSRRTRRPQFTEGAGAPGDAVLCKGSRSAHTDEIIRALSGG